MLRISRVPRPSLKLRRAAGLAAAFLGLNAAAAAQTELAAAPSGGLQIEYRAPPNCPDIEAFKALVRARVPVAWEESASPRFERRVLVQVSEAEERFTATVQLADRGGAEHGAKTVSGNLCRQVVDAAALVTAIAIQSPTPPEDQASVDPVATVPEPPVGAAAATTTAPSGQAAETTPRPRTARDEPRSGAAREQRSSRRARPSLGLRVSGRALLAAGIVPKGAPGAGVGIVFEPRRARLGLALQGFRTGRVEARGVEARFQLLTARLDGCPFVLSLSGWASVEPCAFAEVGMLSGEGFENPPTVVRGKRGTSPWYSTGGAARAVGRWGWLVVELEGLLGVPLRRERFYVERGEEIHRVRPYYGTLGAGLGIRF